MNKALGGSDKPSVSKIVSTVLSSPHGTTMLFDDAKTLSQHGVNDTTGAIFIMGDILTVMYVILLIEGDDASDPTTVCFKNSYSPSNDVTVCVLSIIVIFRPITNAVSAA